MRTTGAMRIVLSGYYDFGNAGDEAVLATDYRRLRRRIPSADLLVLSGDRGGDRELQVEGRASLRWTG